MLDSILSTAQTATGIAMADVLVCLAVSLVTGLLIAFVHMYKNTYTKGFVVTVALLPAMVQAVIMLVNGNLGAGVAVMGAFGLVRFRSIPGGAREISSIFFAMAAGLAAGMGYVGFALLFTALIGGVLLLLHTTAFGEGHAQTKFIRVTVPENVDYTHLFDDLFHQYTRSAKLERVKTTNLGSLYEVRYTVQTKNDEQEKALLDGMRQRNGNLPIICGCLGSKEEL